MKKTDDFSWLEDEDMQPEPDDFSWLEDEDMQPEPDDFSWLEDEDMQPEPENKNLKQVSRNVKYEEVKEGQTFFINKELFKARKSNLMSANTLIAGMYPLRLKQEDIVTIHVGTATMEAKKLGH